MSPMDNEKQKTGLFRRCLEVNMTALRRDGSTMERFFADFKIVTLRQLNWQLRMTEDGRVREITWLTHPNEPRMERYDFVRDTRLMVHEIFVGFVSWEQVLPGEHASNKAIGEPASASIGRMILKERPQYWPEDTDPHNMYVERNDIYHFLRVRGGWERVGSVDFYGPPTFEQYWLSITPFIDLERNLEAGSTDIEVGED